jgi:hypothetical protein
MLYVIKGNPNLGKEYELIFYNDHEADLFSYYADSEQDLHAEIEKWVFSESENLELKAILHYETTFDRILEGKLIWIGDKKFKIKWRPVWALEEVE